MSDCTRLPQVPTYYSIVQRCASAEQAACMKQGILTSCMCRNISLAITTTGWWQLVIEINRQQDMLTILGAEVGIKR